VNVYIQLILNTFSDIVCRWASWTLRGLPRDDLESDKSWAERKPLENCPIMGAEANLPPVSWGVHEGRKEQFILG